MVRDERDVPLALDPGLGEISCSKQKRKNSPEELEKECAAAATRICFPACGCIEAEGDEAWVKN